LRGGKTRGKVVTEVVTNFSGLVFDKLEGGRKKKKPNPKHGRGPERGGGTAGPGSGHKGFWEKRENRKKKGKGLHTTASSGGVTA